MSAGGKEDMTRGKTPRWECQLWSYISSGDGMQCPMLSSCRTRQMCGWCISDNMELLKQLLDTNQFNPSNYDFIEPVTPGRIFKLVETLAQSMLRVGRVRCLPVPTGLVSLADEHHPIEVRLVPLTANHGAIWRLEDGWVIQLNENDPPVRRRFTLFHEAFHILAHGRTTPVFRKRGVEVGSFNELLADYFAACILAPRKWAEEKWSEVENLDRMSEIFDVRDTAMWIRLKTLSLI